MSGAVAAAPAAPMVSPRMRSASLQLSRDRPGRMEAARPSRRLATPRLATATEARTETDNSAEQAAAPEKPRARGAGSSAGSSRHSEDAGADGRDRDAESTTGSASESSEFTVGGTSSATFAFRRQHAAEVGRVGSPARSSVLSPGGHADAVTGPRSRSRGKGAPGPLSPIAHQAFAARVAAGGGVPPHPGARMPPGLPGPPAGLRLQDAPPLPWQDGSEPASARQLRRKERPSPLLNARPVSSDAVRRMSMQDDRPKSRLRHGQWGDDSAVGPARPAAASSGSRGTTSAPTSPKPGLVPLPQSIRKALALNKALEMNGGMPTPSLRISRPPDSSDGTPTVTPVADNRTPGSELRTPHSGVSSAPTTPAPGPACGYDRWSSCALWGLLWLAAAAVLVVAVGLGIPAIAAAGSNGINKGMWLAGTAAIVGLLLGGCYAWSHVPAAIHGCRRSSEAALIHGQPGFAGEAVAEGAATSPPPQFRKNPLSKHATESHSPV